MKDEIKEVLEALDKIAKGVHYPEDLLYYENCQTLLDYITNLQEELEEQKRIEQASLDTINNLQEEIERLNNKLEKIKEIINYYAVEDEDYSKIYNDEEKELLKVLGEYEK